MKDFKKHLINNNSTISDALIRLNLLGSDAIVFIVDEKNILIGSLTDGDVRRAFIKGVTLSSSIIEIIQDNPRYIKHAEKDVSKIIRFREQNLKIIPVLNNECQVIDVINLRYKKSYLPLDVVIMAGGKGTRLRPLTIDVPKPLLKVGKKPIIEHNLDRLSQYGIEIIGFL